MRQHPQCETAREGVVHLLERNIPADDLPEICLAEWRKSHPNLNQFDAARFTVAVAIKGVGEAEATGSSKQEAETLAAEAFLRRFG